MSRFFPAVIGIVALCASFTARADLYGYVDENGRAHVSDQQLDSRYHLFKKQPMPKFHPDPLNDKLWELTSNSRKKYDPMITRVASQYHLEPALLHAVVTVESGYNPYAISAKGAVGLMQLIPDTAQRYNVVNSKDPKQNLAGGAKYLRDLLQMFDNDLSLVLAAYNAGEQTVIKYGNTIPPFEETRNYVPRVLDFYRRNKRA